MKREPSTALWVILFSLGVSLIAAALIMAFRS
jgi:hypothetical protein